MLVLGILLLLLAAALFIGFLAAGTQEVTFDGGVVDVTMSTLTIYLLGALTLLLLVGGLALVRFGLRQANRRRREKKELSRLSAKVQEHEAASRGVPDEDGRGNGDSTSGTAATSTTEALSPSGTTGGSAPGDAPETSTGTSTGTGTGTTTRPPSGDGEEHGTTRA